MAAATPIAIIPTIILTIIGMNDACDWRLILAAWLSPFCPVGGYTYSHGLEWAVDQKLVSTQSDVIDYIRAVLHHGGGWSDLIFAASAWRAMKARDFQQLDAIADLAAAMRSTGELALESRQQGIAFARIARAAWPNDDYDSFARARDNALSFPVAVGAAAAARCAPLQDFLILYAQNFAANLISAAIRLIPLGQTDGQRALAALSKPIMEAAMRAEQTTLDDLGAATPMIDLFSIRHETQYTRLFRS